MAFSFYVELDVNGKRQRFEADRNAVTADERRAASYEAVNDAYLALEDVMDELAGDAPASEDKDVR